MPWLFDGKIVAFKKIAIWNCILKMKRPGLIPGLSRSMIYVDQ